jgi:Holliday junction DNA helicase RuvA
MIAFLRGELLEKHPNRLIIDVHGVGYEVHVPLSTYYNVGDTPAVVSLRVHTHVREDALQLFGFLTELEQTLFERLIGVSGIGSKLALSVLSGIEPAELVGSIQRADVARLVRVPGVGKKTAERIVLELKDRVANMTPEPGAVAAASGDRLRDDLVSALMNLGYHRPPAEQAVDTVLTSEDGDTFEQALRAALRELMR